MKAFGAVMILATCGFGVTFDILTNQDDKEDSSIIMSLIEVYQFSFSVFSVDEYDRATTVLFYIGSIFLPLIMVNMLIAIMSDTYEKIVNAQETSDG